MARPVMCKCFKRNGMSVIAIILMVLVTEISSEKYEQVTDCILDAFQRDVIKFVCDPNKSPIKFENQSEIYCRYYQTLPESTVKENGLPKISFHNCRLMHLSTLVKWNKAVQSLDIKSTGLQAIDSNSFEYADELLILDASENELNALPSALFRYSKKISRVNFSSNKIVTIDPTSFENAGNLRFLDLSKNLIREIDNRTFAKLYQLESLELSSNLIGALPDGVFDDLRKLKFLMLSKNAISHLQCSLFANLLNLDALYVMDNNLQEFNSSCIQTQSNGNIFLCIEGNQLTNLTLLRNMRDVYAANNRLKWITVDQNLDMLYSLNVSNNKIENIPQILQQLSPNLRQLDVSDNPVGVLNSSTLAKFRKLFILSLRNTNLSYIANDAFRQQRDLISLNLSNNNLTKIDFGTVEWNLDSLEFLSLDGNRLERLDNFDGIKLPVLRYLSINNNTFSCGYLAEFLKQLEAREISTKMPGSSVMDGNGIDGRNVDGVACYNDSNSADRVFSVEWLLLFLLAFLSFSNIY
ncbi:hypothetical protein HA402_001559 [Bradysia odoriphaga]|nr:hypothetical protein HA402_001559 [Bradysia odoriphaga]